MEEQGRWRRGLELVIEDFVAGERGDMLEGVQIVKQRGERGRLPGVSQRDQGERQYVMNTSSHPLGRQECEYRCLG